MSKARDQLQVRAHWWSDARSLFIIVPLLGIKVCNMALPIFRSTQNNPYFSNMSSKLIPLGLKKKKSYDYNFKIFWR